MMTSAMTPAIEMRDYAFAYAASDTRVLDGVSFSLEPGTFTVLCGVTGSGKSTLLRALKPELAVAGNASGKVIIDGEDPATWEPVESAKRVGFVMQDPESQLVTDMVWHELAFGLENIAMDTATMRRRVAETAHFFGIGALFERKVKDLSGGQKQLLNLASVVVMQPSILVLDEPTSQLDPIAAKDFFDVLGRVNDELGITVVIIEHRLEEVLPLADRVLYLGEGGRLAFNGTPQAFVHDILRVNEQYAYALPAATRIARIAPLEDAETPITVKQGREYLAQVLRGLPDVGASCAREGARECAPAKRRERVSALAARDLWFRYSKDDPFVLRGIDFEVRSGEVAALVGGNGSGKSTLLMALAGSRKPERGKVKNPNGLHVALMTQDPKVLFVKQTLFDDLMEWSEQGGYDESAVEAMLEHFGLASLRDRHPYDLSGGETQKAALAKVLLLDPDVLLLDEPTKGIDAVAKRQIGEELRQLAERGKAVLFTAHDLEFVSEFADVTSMMFGCEVTCTQDTHGFFTDNLFYSTATSRITRGIIDGCVATDDVKRALGGSADEIVGARTCAPAEELAGEIVGARFIAPAQSSMPNEGGEPNA